ncbi:hypothetical protein FOB60_001422 [Candida parapsilosis]|nr:hypothetical protein FOB60_001422 [Candida parapsilosis]
MRNMRNNSTIKIESNGGDNQQSINNNNNNNDENELNDNFAGDDFVPTELNGVNIAAETDAIKSENSS